MSGKLTNTNDRLIFALKLAALLAVALFSWFVVAEQATSPEFHKETIMALDEKRDTVMELTAASTAVSVAITMIPGDAATPVAEKLADLSTCFLLVLSTIYLEKYLVTITGYAAFYILIPAACVLCAAGLLFKNEIFKFVAMRLAFFGILIVLIIPTSVKVSNMIEDTYESSMQTTIDLALQTTEEIEEDAKVQERAGEQDNQETGLFSGLISKVTDTLSETVSLATDKVENVLNHYLEALAVLLVTSCGIPVLVMFFFVWLMRVVLDVNIGTPIRMLLEGHSHH